MDDTPHHNEAKAAEWAAILAESEAEAGLFVSGDEILRELHESIARMENRATPGHADAAPGSPPHR
jgi:hypothetical protein